VPQADLLRGLAPPRFARAAGRLLADALAGDAGTGEGETELLGAHECADQLACCGSVLGRAQAQQAAELG
jgi:hypothetical protein